MKNNKGFSILELIVSFTLTMVIVVILFEIIVAMKDVYEKSVTKTELINKQNIFTDLIYNDINSYGLSALTACGNNCIQFSYGNGTVKNLVWAFDNVSTNQENTQYVSAFQTLQYGDYKADLIKNSSFDPDLISNDSNNNQFQGLKICSDSNYSSTNVDSYVSISLPIYNTMFKDEDFGLNIIYTYINGQVSNSLPISNTCSV